MTKQPRRAEWPGIHLSPTIPLTPFLPGRGQKKRAGGTPPKAPWQKGCAPLHSPRTRPVVARRASDEAIWGGGVGLALSSSTHQSPCHCEARATKQSGVAVPAWRCPPATTNPPVILSLPTAGRRSEESTYQPMLRFPFVPQNKTRHTTPLRANLRLNVPVKPYSFPHSFARKTFHQAYKKERAVWPAPPLCVAVCARSW